MPEIIPFASGHGGLGTGLATRVGDDAGLQVIVPNSSEESVPVTGQLNTLAPDGKTLATNSANYSGAVPILDANTGRVARTLSVPPETWVDQVKFAPDGKTVAALCNADTIRIWEPSTARTMRVIAELEGDDDVGLLGIFFAPNSKILASYSGTRLFLWNPDTGLQVRQFPITGYLYMSFTLSPDGTILAAGGDDRTMNFWDVATGKLIRQFSIQFVAHYNDFAPDGETITSRNTDSTLAVWNVNTGKEVVRVRIEELRLSGNQVLSPDQRMLAGAFPDATIRVWDVATGKQVRRIQLEPTELAHNIVFSPDCKTLA